MISINIIGTGNVAWHMAQALQKTKAYHLQAVAGRSKKNLKDFKDLAETTTAIERLAPAHITMIMVTDDAIQEVTQLLPYNTGLMVHTSGSVSMEVLSSFNQQGVFYPLQSFSKEVAVSFYEVPICIEASNEQSLEMLRGLGFALSEKVTETSSAQRKKLHLAAVFVNNFSNHCFTIAQQLCEQNQLSFDLLRPLLDVTSTKALKHRPDNVQTGPAKRDDQQTIAAHLAQLTTTEHQEVYKILSDAITSYYGKKL